MEWIAVAMFVMCGITLLAVWFSLEGMHRDYMTLTDILIEWRKEDKAKQGDTE